MNISDLVDVSDIQYIRGLQLVAKNLIFLDNYYIIFNLLGI